MTVREAKSMPSPTKSAVVLAVSPLPADCLRLREILFHRNWVLQEASDCGQALPRLRNRSIPVLLCERELTDGNWADLLKATARLPAPPNLIVFSRHANKSLWVEVRNMGGFDVLVTPFEPEEVLRVAFAAWRRWECEFSEAAPKKPMQQAQRLEEEVVTLPFREGAASEGSSRLRAQGAGIKLSDKHKTDPDAGVAEEGNGLIVLLADDDAGVRDILGRFLRSQGYTVLEAADGVEALEAAARHSGTIHLLLTDWCMPRLDGGGLICGLRNARPETAILVVSGEADVKPPSKAAVLHKPFTSGDLVRSIRGALHGQ